MWQELLLDRHFNPYPNPCINKMLWKQNQLSQNNLYLDLIAKFLKHKERHCIRQMLKFSSIFILLFFTYFIKLCIFDPLFLLFILCYSEISLNKTRIKVQKTLVDKLLDRKRENNINRIIIHEFCASKRRKGRFFTINK